MYSRRGFVRKSVQLVAIQIATFSTLGIFSGCSTYRVAPDSTIADTPVKSGVTAFEAATEIFAADLHNSATANPSNPAAVTVLAVKAFKSGIAMIDMQCNRYLYAIGGANQAASNERKQVGLIGGFTSAIMGLTGSSAKQIAGVATSFSFASSSMDAFTSAYLFSDAASSVTKIVRESQIAWLTSLLGAGGLDGIDYSGSVALLSRYESLCHPAQIRALIDQSIAKGTVVAITSLPSDSDVKNVLAAMNAAFMRPFTEHDAINLYAWYKFPAERESGPKLSNNETVSLLLKEGRSKAELERLLAQVFLSISLAGSPVPARWEPGVQALRNVGVIPEQPPAAAAPPGSNSTVMPQVISLPSVSNIQLRMPTLTIR